MVILIIIIILVQNLKHRITRKRDCSRRRDLDQWNSSHQNIPGGTKFRWNPRGRFWEKISQTRTIIVQIKQRSKRRKILGGTRISNAISSVPFNPKRLYFIFKMKILKKNRILHVIIILKKFYRAILGRRRTLLSWDFWPRPVPYKLYRILYAFDSQPVDPSSSVADWKTLNG